MVHRPRSLPAAAVRVVRAVLVLAAVLLALPAAAQPSPPGAYRDVRGLPDGAVGERLAQVVAALRSDDPADRRRLVDDAFEPGFRDAFPMEQHLQVLGDLAGQGLELHGHRLYPDREVPAGEHTLILRNPLTETWRGLVVRLEPQPPHRILGMQILPARPPSDLPAPGPVDRAALVAELQAYVEKLAAADAFSGTLLLARDGEVWFQGAYGPASRRYDVPNRIDTKLNLGSMNKMFTAVAIGKLVEAGKLAWTDPLSKHLGDAWLAPGAAQRIQIRHLLSHTSGLGSYFTDEFMDASRMRYRSVDDYAPLVADDAPAFEPGSEWSYSNTGFLLLGAVIEAVTGEDYFSWMRQNVYAPAGMASTDCYEMDHPVPNLAIGYSRHGDGWVNNLYMHVIRGGPAGGGFSTAPDLLAFDRALRAGELVSPATLEILTTAKPELSSPDYGYGFGVQEIDGGRVVGHTGGFPGINAALDMYLDSGWTVIALANLDQGAMPVRGKMRELIARYAEEGAAE